MFTNTYFQRMHFQKTLDIANVYKRRNRHQ